MRSHLQWRIGMRRTMRIHFRNEMLTFEKFESLMPLKNESLLSGLALLSNNEDYMNSVLDEYLQIKLNEFIIKKWFLIPKLSKDKDQGGGGVMRTERNLKVFGQRVSTSLNTRNRILKILNFY